MANHIHTGKLGEQIALKHIEQLGYRVLALNWRKGKGELDIIAKDSKIIVFIEVKTRMNNNFGFPEDSLNAAKQKMLITTARRYLTNYFEAYDEVRFDVVSVSLEEQIVVHYFKDAFWM